MKYLHFSLYALCAVLFSACSTNPAPPAQLLQKEMDVEVEFEPQESFEEKQKRKRRWVSGEIDK